MAVKICRGLNCNNTTLVAAAETAARDSHRTVSNLIELALIQYLQREGYLSCEQLRKWVQLLVRLARHPKTHVNRPILEA